MKTFFITSLASVALIWLSAHGPAAWAQTQPASTPPTANPPASDASPDEASATKSPVNHLPIPGVDSHINVTYAEANGKPLKLDLYVPQGATKPLPVVIWIHGGGWVGGKKDVPWTKPVDKWVLAYTQSGFALATIDYRLSFQAKFPAQIQDCKAAVRWVRAHAADYGLNPNKIGVTGSSAGGHLVALLGTTPDNPALEGDEGNKGVSSRVQAVCDFFGPTDFLTIYQQEEPARQKKAYAVDDAISKLLGGPIDQNREAARLASPVYYINAQTCPFFIAHGDLDPLVPLQQSIEFNEALQKAGIPSTLYVVKGGRHGVRDPVAFQKSIDFLKQYLQTP